MEEIPLGVDYLRGVVEARHNAVMLPKVFGLCHYDTNCFKFSRIMYSFVMNVKCLF